MKGLLFADEKNAKLVVGEAYYKVYHSFCQF